MIAKTMQAIEITAANTLKLIPCPLPELADGQVLIKVAAAGVNRPDIAKALQIDFELWSHKSCSIRTIYNQFMVALAIRLGKIFCAVNKQDTFLTY